MKKLLPVLTILLAGCPQTGPVDVLDLVPLDNEISGWVRAGEMSTAENATRLFELIDGEGQVYVDNGFVKCAFQVFSGEADTPVELELRVFDMGDSTNAAAVYAAVASGAETPWTGDNPGAEARIDESPLSALKVDFRARRFYVWLTIADKSTTALGVARLFALNVDAAIAAGGS